MSTNENPAPRANAGNRANSKTEQGHNRPSGIDWEADAAAVWLARCFPMPAALARLVAALASLGRAFR
jgi:hypothetical protein